MYKQAGVHVLVLKLARHTKAVQCPGCELTALLHCKMGSHLHLTVAVF